MISLGIFLLMILDNCRINIDSGLFELQEVIHVEKY